jgi:hypothetical protein
VTVSDIMQAMADAGAPLEAILIAVRAIEERDAEAAAKRAAATQRKRDERSRKGMSRDSHATMNGQSHGQSQQKENPPDPKKEKPTPLNGSPKGEPIPPPAEPDQPDLRPEHVLEAWNAMADRAGVPKAKLTPERRKKLSTFIRRHPVDDITEAIGAIERSPFLRGENDRSWRADFNWMLEPRNFTKLTEGTYDR